MKQLLFLFAFIFINSIYSQSTCGAGYGFTYSHIYGCTYTFSPYFPRPHPCIAYLSWGISSSGTYKRECERINSDTLPYTYTFCFYGNHDVTMFIRFCDSSWCYVTQTINVICNGALFCNPDPGNDSIPDPLVEITYLGINYDCGVQAGSDYHDCMNYSYGGGYLTACAWDWAVKIVPSAYDCEYWTYHMQWVDYKDCPTEDTCQYILMEPNHVYCITARIAEGIVIWADGNHCCFPAGYQRGFLWYPFPTGAGITDPDIGYDWGQCAAYRCPTSGDCIEDQITMDETVLPTTHCPQTNFTGSYKIQLRDYKINEDNLKIYQDVSIFNTQGKLVFNGKWKFGDSGNLNISWPGGLVAGMYFVKFPNSSYKGMLRSTNKCNFSKKGKKAFEGFFPFGQVVQSLDCLCRKITASSA